MSGEADAIYEFGPGGQPTKIKLYWSDAAEITATLRLASVYPSYLPGSIDAGASDAEWTASAWQSNPRDLTFSRPDHDDILVRWQYNADADVPFRVVKEPPPPLVFTKELPDIGLGRGEQIDIDLGEYVSLPASGSVAWQIDVTTTNQRTGQTRTAPINTIARNKVHGSLDGAVLTLTGGRAVAQTLSLNVTATNDENESASDSFDLELLRFSSETLETLMDDFVKEATSVGDFVEGLPDLHKSQSMYLTNSMGGDADYVAADTPRMVSWGATADHVFAWGSNSSSPRYHQVEFMLVEDVDDGWVFGIIDFSDETPKIRRRDPTCNSCHLNHPLWPMPMYGRRGFWYPSFDVAHALRDSPDARIGGLNLPVTGTYSKQRVEHDLALRFSARDAEVLFATIQADVEADPNRDMDSFAKDMVCSAQDQIWDSLAKTYFPVSRSLNIMGPVLRNLNPRGTVSDDLYRTGVNVAEEYLVLPSLSYLGETNDDVAALYEDSSNSAWGRTWSLHYLPGTATLKEELDSKMELFFTLKGSENIERRKTIEYLRTPGAYLFITPYNFEVDVVSELVCDLLNDE